MRYSRLFLCFFTVLALLLPLGCTLDPNIANPAVLLFEKVVVTSAASWVSASGGTTQITAKVYGRDGKFLADVIVTFETTAGELLPSNKATTNAQGEATVTLQTSARALVSAHVAEVNSEGVTVDIDSPVTLEITPELAPVGSESNFTFTATREDGHSVTGTLFIDFGDGTEITIENFTFESTIQHIYDAAGTYSVIVQLTQTAGQTLTRQATFDLVEPEPEAPPTATPAAGDQLDPNIVTYLHADISNWAVTSVVNNVEITGSNICIDHTKAGQWPEIDFVEGNPWVFANIDGQWYGGTYEWLRPGQICKGITADTIGGHVKEHPMEDWVPRSGELVGFAVSTHARFGGVSSNERSNIVLVIWP